MTDNFFYLDGEDIDEYLKTFGELNVNLMLIKLRIARDV